MALNATPEPGGGEHVEVVGAVADGHGVLDRDPGLVGEAAQRLGLAGPVDDLADDPAGEPAVDDLELVGGDVVDAELFGDRLDDRA